MTSRSYYGRPILKEPVWTWEVPVYFVVGGIGGAANALAFAARVGGNDVLARRARLLAMAALSVSPPLLISDLGRPERFLNMLRVVKPTSPMSVGSWLLVAGGSSSVAATVLERLGRLRRVQAAAQASAAVLGLPVATYTGALVAQTAIPAWHEARRELPFVFAATAAAGAGAAAALATPADSAGPARRLAVLGGIAELAAVHAMERRLGPLVGEPYRLGRAGRLTRLGKACTVAGTALTALAGRRRGLSVAGAVSILAGAALEKWAVYDAGFQSARDPRYVVEPQRARLGS